MSAQRKIPEAVARAQIEASNPEVSAWVAANAGAGKTHVLAQRVIRLLLAGVAPARILCITFTKAAAANMANRVFERLGAWTALDDSALDAEMRTVGVDTIDAEVRARARRLFALALETPGGLKVQTIHAFCTHLLHLFPFEAQVAARFEVLDEAAEAQLLDRVMLAVLLEGAGNPQGSLGRALETAIAAAADQTFRQVLKDAIGARDKLTAWLDATGGVDGAIAQLSGAFGIDANDTEEKIDAVMLSGSPIKPSEWPVFAAALAGGAKTDKDHSERFASLAQLGEGERREVYLDIFCTKDRSPRANIVTKAIQVNHGALYARLLNEQRRVCALLESKRAVIVRDRTAALVTIAAAVIARYRAEKDRRGLLDYDDLIDKSLGLLSRVEAAWVHYKLDRGIDHVLIDEAQDTSPRQWDIIERLTAEFFAGKGARDFVKRTIFAVGDEKQSIFSFQGAAPYKFAEMRRHFERVHTASGLDFVYSVFKYSFRSGPNILGAVDTVFLRPEAYAGLTADPVPTVHEGLPEAAPGLVEIWQPLSPEDKREIEAWDAPFDVQSEQSPVVRLARKIASNIAAWRRLGLRPGEVLILVRRRGALFEAIIRALKDANIAVAGADRLVLTEHIAVMDLIALADALLLPDDDLALATVLKSPLFGFDEGLLFDIAWNRKGSLRAALHEKAGENSQIAAAAARLDELADDARRETPFAFYARLINAHGGRAKILKRLGHEAADALDEFLNLALDYEQSETPSLQGFVAWLRAASASIKRDMEIKRDEVRVMTVHGAKGLEAHTVVLADTTTPPQGWHPPRLLPLVGTPEGLIWARRKDDDVGPMADARTALLEAAENEYRRLLYVAMTRAAQRLVVCGADGKNGRPEGCWYDLVYDALKDLLVEEPADDGDGTVWRFRKTMGKPEGKEKAESEAEPIKLPDWLTRDAPQEPPLVNVLSPSRALAEETRLPARAPRAAERDESRARRAKFLRGNLAHRLLQSLPDIAPERRADAAQRYLARAAKEEDLPTTERDAIAAQVLAVLGDEKFAALFAPGSRAEVPVTGRHGDGLVVGQIDRLAVTTDEILIADYKTNRDAPRTLEEAIRSHKDYIAQLALYRAVLARLYPGRAVRAALLWTEVPQIMEIPASALDAALADLPGRRMP
jgi:ATP-dependent helicase/nuclease subunit A